MAINQWPMSFKARAVCWFFVRMSSMVSGREHLNVIWESQELLAYLHPSPWTPGVAVVTHKTSGSTSSLFHLPEDAFVCLLLGARTVARLLCEKLDVRRCALVHTPHARAGSLGVELFVIPLHGVTELWKPHVAAEEDFQPYDPGYISSKSGPRWTDSCLEEIKNHIRARLPVPNTALNYTYLGEASDRELFPRIVRGEEKQWRVWEDDSHIAVLTPFPNTPGLTVLIPRKPLSSDILRLEAADYKELVLATRQVSRLLEAGLDAWGVGLIFEGFEIDYAHAKLIPLVSSPDKAVLSLTCPASDFTQLYPGYVTSVYGPPANIESLQEFCSKITHR
ncbi:uncharacterized protein LOC130424739 isoform X2 [Triplophysa dalaica]|uniref:uncharacterized protein LOC130424739 isoform X2 n=1 Tax=Triplophysa dalaica TaxID=1582913 RepID=UPI0024DFFAC0|nr:uncharacterized protein LOC130424739 isoform X2 [Triplophysa dalaica]